MLSIEKNKHFNGTYSIKMDNEEYEIKDDGTPVFKQEPSPYERHPINYIRYFGEILGRFRKSLPIEQRGTSKLGESFGELLGHPVNRNRISRVESGDLSVSFEVYAAYITKMKAWPDVISALETGKAGNLRYLLLVQDELSEDIEEAIEKAKTILADKKEAEIKELNEIAEQTVSDVNDTAKDDANE